MCRYSSALRRSFLVLLAGLLPLSARLLWAQMTQPEEGVPIQLFNQPIQPASRTAVTWHPSSVSKGLPNTLGAPPNQTGLRIGFFAPPTNYYPAIDNRAVANVQQTSNPWRLSAAPLFPAGNASGQWIKAAYDNASYRTVQSVGDVRKYGYPIPWAGPIILRISEKAKAHPHVVGALKLLTPQF